jgi:addiction module HigA family antidote
MSEVLNGKRAISAETALRLGRYFGTSAQSWMNLQATYDMEMARRSLGALIAQEVKPRAA